MLICLLAFTNSFAKTENNEKSALIIIDMQNCFVPGKDKRIHSLPVVGGHKIIKGINSLQKKFDLVIATKDWHPDNHMSFASNHQGKKPFESIELKNNKEQTLWPDHCVPGTKGADFANGLDTSKIQDIIYKGINPNVDSYSGFYDNFKSSQTILHKYLKKKGVKKIYIVGLAADYCVKFTALDGVDLGYETYIIEDMTKAVFPQKIQSEYEKMREIGVKIIKSAELNLRK